MDSKIPLPTDNIYKFYALFGLTLLFACVYAFVQLYNTYSTQATKRYIELQTLSAIAKPTAEQTAKLTIIKNQELIAASDKAFFLKALGLIIGAALILLIYGFYQWHRKIQPLQDQMISMQLEKLNLEIEAMKQSKLKGGNQDTSND
jgi:hypothetical protein